MEQRPTFLLVAGEASGDLHGARVIEALSRRVPGARFVGMGGPKMREAGLEALYDARELSVMGFIEVLPKLFRILSVLRGLGRWAAEHRPTAALLIDLPDFNLRLARRLRRLGVPVSYYVAPMAWAWRSSRVAQLRAFVDRLFCIYPFEERWFRDRGVTADFVGNPLLEEPLLARPLERTSCRAALGLRAEGPLIALLPGSRAAEIARVLPGLVEAARLLAARHDALHFVLPIAATLDREAIARLCAPLGPKLSLIDGRTTEVLGACDSAVVCSGTATLEAALVGRPMVVVYRASAISYAIARRLVRLDHVCIVNLLAGRRLVSELIQDGFTPDAVVAALEAIWPGSPPHARMAEELVELRSMLGGPGASDRTAASLLESLADRGTPLLLAGPG